MRLDRFWRRRLEITRKDDVAEVLASVGFLVLPRDVEDVVDLSVCAAMPHLRDLVVHAPHVVGKDAVARIPGLRELTVSGRAFGPADLVHVGRSATLVDLMLTDMDLGTPGTPGALDAVARAPRLESLTLSRVSGLGAAQVARLSRLTTLRVTRTDLGDLTPLRDMESLRHLELSHVDVDSLDLLPPGIETFECDTVARDEGGLAALAGSTHLTELRYPLSDLAFLARCPNLAAVRVRGDVEPDLAPLVGLPVRSLDVYLATSREQAERVVARAKSLLPTITATGWRTDW